LLTRLTEQNRVRGVHESVASADGVASYLFTGRTERLLPALLSSRPLAGVTEVTVHPGLPEENGPLDLGNRALERYLSSAGRRAELDACVAARSRPHTWRLTTYRELAQREGT